MQPAPEAKYSDRHDYHSYGNPEEVRVRHVALDLTVLFDEKKLRGSVTLRFERTAAAKPDAALMLDTRNLKIAKVEASADGSAFRAVKFELGETDKILGTSLKIAIAPKDSHVRIGYETSPEASGLQWLSPEQTAGKKHPFLFSQSEAIHARSWIPLQDSPSVRVTYSAHIRTPKQLRALMSARNNPQAPETGDFTFEMPQPIPSYLIALAVGDLEFGRISRRSGVYAEPSLVKGAAKELDDTEKMMEAAERLYGPYRWEEYDLLILPPSFPFGGMENPRLTFATPTILAGDKSLVGLVAHELAHSWSGNLVTNATWSDFWLNEGFTTYIERRIQEVVYGKARSEMEALLEKQELVKELAKLPPADQILYVDLKGRDPDEGFTQVPYVKGMLFLRRLEEVFGRDRFDAFLRSYFDHFAFKSIVTADFVDYLNSHLLQANPTLAAKVNVEEWLTKPGLPADAPDPASDAFDRVSEIAKSWSEGKIAVSGIPVKSWSTQETQHFLRSLPEHLGSKRMGELDRTFHFTASGNSEILFEWLMMSIRNRYTPAYPKLDSFLMHVGRRKFIKPLYEELVKTAEGRERAKSIYAQARPGYHPIAQTSIDEVFAKSTGASGQR